MMLLNYIAIFYLASCYYQPNLHIVAEPMKGYDIEQAEENEYKFVVSIGKKNRISRLEEFAHFCGGTLISRRHVLTAAHCIENQDLRSIDVTVGSINLRNANDRYDVESAVTYDEYASMKCAPFSSGNHDIGILKLSRCVKAENEIVTLTLFKNPDFYGSQAIMAGWGKTETGTMSPYLLISNTTIINNKDCQKVVEESLQCHVYTYPGKRFFCSKTDPYVLLGPGDSGGPILINGNEQIGLIHGICPHDIKHPNLTPRQRVNVFLGIHYYSSFISSIINGRQRMYECTII